MAALITDNLAPCIAITISNKSTNTVALAHVDDTTTRDSVLKMIQGLRTNEKEELIVNIIGGNNVHYGPEGGKIFFQPLIACIYKLPNTAVFSHNLFEKGGADAANAIAININGEVYLNDQVQKLCYTSYIKMKLSSRMTPLKVLQCKEVGSEYNCDDYGGLSLDQFEALNKLPAHVIASVCGDGAIHKDTPDWLIDAMEIRQTAASEVPLSGDTFGSPDACVLL